MVVYPALGGSRYDGVFWWAVIGDALHNVGAQTLPWATFGLEKLIRNVVWDSREVWRGDGGSAGEGEGGSGGRGRGRVIRRRGRRKRASAFRVVVPGPLYWRGGRGSNRRLGNECLRRRGGEEGRGGGEGRWGREEGRRGGEEGRGGGEGRRGGKEGRGGEEGRRGGGEGRRGGEEGRRGGGEGRGGEERCVLIRTNTALAFSITI